MTHIILSAVVPVPGRDAVRLDFMHERDLTQAVEFEAWPVHEFETASSTYIAASGWCNWCHAPEDHANHG